jgi:transposase-like protein
MRYVLIIINRIPHAEERRRRVSKHARSRGSERLGNCFTRSQAGDIDDGVNAFLDRPIDGEWPYLWRDATSLKVRDGGRIVSAAAIIAVAVMTEGRRAIGGIGSSAAEPHD